MKSREAATRKLKLSEFKHKVEKGEKQTRRADIKAEERKSKKDN